MGIDLGRADRWIMGEAWIGSSIGGHVQALCDDIGVRWGGSDGERRAAEYIAGCLGEYGLSDVRQEEFPLLSWRCDSAEISVAGEEDWVIDVRPTLSCPAVDVSAPLVDVGYGMPHETARVRERLAGSIALIDSGFEPFSPQVTFTTRLDALAEAGVRVAITPSPHGGRRTSHTSANDWRDGGPGGGPVPVVQTSREDGAKLKVRAGRNATVSVRVDAKNVDATSRNVVGDIPGARWPEEQLFLSAHFDTTPDSFGGNDNGSGSSVTLETSRLLSRLVQEEGVRPGRSIRFALMGSEEQTLQGSFAYVARHHGPEPLPRLSVFLDELATGNLKGVVLAFPHLRDFIQAHLDAMPDGFPCHVMAQYDASGDSYPFVRAGAHTLMMWRWRFVGRHPDVAYGHSSGDTADKVRVRELKEYAGFLARLLLRLSHVPPSDWPENTLDVEEIARQVEAQRGSVVRTM